VKKCELGSTVTGQKYLHAIPLNIEKSLACSTQQIIMKFFSLYPSLVDLLAQIF
jgi:hypothetical protein